MQKNVHFVARKRKIDAPLAETNSYAAEIDWDVLLIS